MNDQQKRQLLEQALGRGGGVVRLMPNWVPRVFCVPGRRLRLDTRDLYAFGLNRGGIANSTAPCTPSRYRFCVRLRARSICGDPGRAGSAVMARRRACDAIVAARSVVGSPGRRTAAGTTAATRAMLGRKMREVPAEHSLITFLSLIEPRERRTTRSGGRPPRCWSSRTRTRSTMPSRRHRVETGCTGGINCPHWSEARRQGDRLWARYQSVPLTRTFVILFP
jgi:hypothetical protein